MFSMIKRNRDPKEEEEEQEEEKEKNRKRSYGWFQRYFEIYDRKYVEYIVNFVWLDS